MPITTRSKRLKLEQLKKEEDKKGPEECSDSGSDSGADSAADSDSATKSDIEFIASEESSAEEAEEADSPSVSSEEVEESDTGKLGFLKYINELEQRVKNGEFDEEDEEDEDEEEEAAGLEEYNKDEISDDISNLFLLTVEKIVHNSMFGGDKCGYEDCFCANKVDPLEVVGPTSSAVAVVEEPRVNIKDFVLNPDVKVCKTVQNLITLLDHVDATLAQRDLRNALIELNELIGLDKLKEQLVNQILFFMEDLIEPGTFLHTVITGNPGTGKTTLIHILAKIYKSMGILKEDKVVKADRTTMIAEYLGQTAIKTKKVLDSAKGGILLIDEAYALGDPSTGNPDIFSVECINTINQYLSEHVNELVCIICGYEKDIQKCFFSKNSGLERRFQWRFNIETYTAEELYNIFIKQMDKWTIDVPKEYIVAQIKKHSKSFSGNGGSTRSLIDKCKINYAQRNFNNKSSLKVLSIDDFNKGLETMTANSNKKMCGFCVERDSSNKEEHDCEGCKVKKFNSDSMYS